MVRALALSREYEVRWWIEGYSESSKSKVPKKKCDLGSVLLSAFVRHDYVCISDCEYNQLPVYQYVIQIMPTN